MPKAHKRFNVEFSLFTAYMRRPIFILVALMTVAGVGACAIVSLLFGDTVGRLAGLAILPPLLLAVFMILRMWHHLQNDLDTGELLPAVVVSKSPCKLAVLGNLTMNRQGEEPYHAIKVYEEALNETNCPGLAEGMTLPVVAIFEPADGPDGAYRYGDFEPISPYLFTKDTAQIKFIRDQIHKEDWRLLEKSLPHLPDKHMPGLHLLTPNAKPGRKRRLENSSTMKRMVSALWKT